MTNREQPPTQPAQRPAGVTLKGSIDDHTADGTDSNIANVDPRKVGF